MKNRRLLIPLLALSLFLAACASSETEPETETPTGENAEQEGSTTDSATSGVREEDQIPTESVPDDPDYALLDQAKKEYYSGELDAAAGTLSRLLQKDLSDKELLEAEAEHLKEEISEKQAENARMDSETQNDSVYSEERQSSLLTEEYEAATGQSMSEATDDELEAWLDQREEADVTDSGMTKDEAEALAFEQVRERVEIEGENYFSFVEQEDGDWVKVEVRESVEQDGVTFSNLIGLYRYNVETEELLKLDVITGEYTELED